MYIEKINSPEDLKKLNIEEMTSLAEEMRKALIKNSAFMADILDRILEWLKQQLHFTMFLIHQKIK